MPSELICCVFTVILVQLKLGLLHIDCFVVYSYFSFHLQESVMLMHL